MNLKLKRLVRTSSSEQYALFDLAQTDEDDQPATIGKLDLHYTGEGTYGTILLWDIASQRMDHDRRRVFVRSLLNELVVPMGLPNEFVIEFFAPSLDQYELFHNLDENYSEMQANADPDTELADHWDQTKPPD